MTPPPQPAQPRPVAGARRRMFWRMLLRSLLVRPSRSLTALLALAVAAAVSTAMLNLYLGLEAKLRTEFRNYGANVVVVSRDQQTSLRADALARVRSVLGPRDLAVPFAYAIAQTSNGSPIVAAGTEMEGARRLNSWWGVTGWPKDSDQALLGSRVVALLGPGGRSMELSFEGKKISLQMAGVLRTGAAEESRVYMGLEQFEAWTGVGPSAVEIQVNGSPLEISSTLSRLAGALPEADVRPVRQILEGEARVLSKTQALALGSMLIIALTVGLCVLATLTASVFERRKDFAVMKALGASQASLVALFGAEAAVLGLSGAGVGFVTGIGLAALIGRINFHAAVAPRLEALPPVLAGTLALALAAALAPMSILRRFEPANILKGE